MNLLVDFELHKDEEGHHLGYQLRLGKCDDFKGVIKALKTIPSIDRNYQEGRDNLWSFNATPTVVRVLTNTFDNFTSCLETADRQLQLL